jgi:GNAT superfamily N-acetyltransferase
MAGYIILAESSARVKQFAVAHEFRKKGIGQQLFYEIQQLVGDKMILLINIDDRDESNVFLQKIGLEMILKQYEMVYRYDRLR